MSHYSLAVIVPKNYKEEELEGYLENVMEPFSEHLEVEPYVAVTKEELERRYNEYKNRADKNEEIELFEEFSNNYCGAGNDEEGNALSTYNPNSKWDWFVIGGRWNNIIKTKESKKVNYAKIKDIEFEAKLNDLELQNIKKEYEKLIKEGDWYKPEYYQERFPTLESYIKSFDFSTYAILDDSGEWFESGKMGWFGMSNSTLEEQKNFEESYMDIIKEQDEENWLMVVDCHI